MSQQFNSIQLIDLTYNSMLTLIHPYLVSGRTESAAFLHWFLVHIYRLDQMLVEDIVCDGPQDRGIDGIYVDEHEEYIDVFQTKITQNSSRTLGDVVLKEFLGTLHQFQTIDKVDLLIATASNPQLKGLLLEKRSFFERGYPIRGIFVTNMAKNVDSDNYLESLESDTNIADKNVELKVWDKTLIERMYVPGERAIPSTTEASFDISYTNIIDYNVGNRARVIIAPISATDLVHLDGIDNQKIFDLNVRKSLGKTKVNKDITKSIGDLNEHNQFILYHNGITIICSRVDVDSEKGKIKIQGYAVVNGCQSLSCLYDKRMQVTPDLKILTRIVEIQPGSDQLLSKITYNSNNQNGVKARDFRSNSIVQVRLQNEIRQNYPKYFYQIKRGDDPGEAVIIDSELAGKLLIVFDLKQPWTVHQSYKIFDEMHQEIFARPEVNGGRIVTLFEVMNEIERHLNTIEPQIFGRYQMTKFFILYILREILDSDPIGKKFCRKPETFYDTEKDLQKLITCIQQLIIDLVVDLNGEFSEEGANFDFKRVLKTQSLSRQLARKVVDAHQKLVSRGRIDSFSAAWDEAN
ncbi:hypothetical protein GKIL_1837 [Gloeobacter kilaueensis JS1]|uniref:Abortive phage infection protein C-terminal domain-containing protein n=2 Tax=Gloeobacter TaxID=33071 RepID=U5QGR4_GLOK1|nr:hypothetical protein GKIL_1837 [Gloeobacter kilaueensis JS1]